MKGDLEGTMQQTKTEERIGLKRGVKERWMVGWTEEST